MPKLKNAILNDFKAMLVVDHSVRPSFWSLGELRYIIYQGIKAIFRVKVMGFLCSSECLLKSLFSRSKWTSQVYSWAFKYEQHQFKFGLGPTSAIYSQCWIPWIPIDLQADQLHYPKYNSITHQCQGSHQYSGTSTNHSTVSDTAKM